MIILWVFWLVYVADLGQLLLLAAGLRVPLVMAASGISMIYLTIREHLTSNNIEHPTISSSFV